MGFLDHLFKLKPNEEKMGGEEKGAGGNGEAAGAVPDPGAFLHPKDFGPRGSGGRFSPIRPAPPVAKMPAPQLRGQEIVLTLGDVLSRIPTQLLQAGLHDANRELRFSIDDLSADIARGRAAVPLSKIAALCPDVFARELTPGDDSEIRLPLQKLVEQIGLLRGLPTEPDAPPISPAAPEAALAKDSPPASEPDSPAPPAPEAAAVPENMPPSDIEPTASAVPAIHVFTPPPPTLTAEPAPAIPQENHTHPPAPQDAPAAAETTPQPVIHLQPPPVVRPVLILPPTLLTTPAPPSEPLVSSIPSAPEQTAPVPAPPAPQPPHFPQEALQALFMTDETLDFAALCRHAAALPGVRACALEVRGEKALAGDAPPGFDLAALHAAATRLPDAGALPIGTLENVTLHGDQAAISLFTRPGVLLAVLHRPLPPGVRDRLATLATAIARQ